MARRAKKKSVTLKPRKSGGSAAKCVFAVYEHLTGPSEMVGLYGTKAKANSAARAKSKENPRFDYWVSRLCVK